MQIRENCNCRHKIVRNSGVHVSKGGLVSLSRLDTEKRKPPCPVWRWTVPLPWATVGGPQKLNRARNSTGGCFHERKWKLWFWEVSTLKCSSQHCFQQQPERPSTEEPVENMSVSVEYQRWTLLGRKEERKLPICSSADGHTGCVSREMSQTEEGRHAVFSLFCGLARRGRGWVMKVERIKRDRVQL